MALSQHQRLFARLLGQLLTHAYASGYELTLGEAYRPQVMQDLYYEQGKTQTRTSRHTQRLAIDLNLFQDGKYRTASADYAPLGHFWTSLHPACVWGGDWQTFRDGNHFELDPRRLSVQEGA